MVVLVSCLLGCRRWFELKAKLKKMNGTNFAATRHSIPTPHFL